MQNKRCVIAAFLVLASFSTLAQLLDTDPDWQESEAPPPPAFSTQKLVPIAMPPGLALEYGVDPSTLRLTPDGIVRYVMVAHSSGATNASYEGIRCSTGEVKVYARYGSSGDWIAVDEPEWMPLFGNPRMRYANILAKQSICSGTVPAGNNTEDLIRRVAQPPRTTYRN